MNGRKRHIITDVLGLIIGLLVHSADVQDRKGADRLLFDLIGRLPRMKTVLADGAYTGGTTEKAEKLFGRVIEVVSRPRDPGDSSSFPGDGWLRGLFPG